jgi:hypothetical protein
MSDVAVGMTIQELEAFDAAFEHEEAQIAKHGSRVDANVSGAESDTYVSGHERPAASRIEY